MYADPFVDQVEIIDNIRIAGIKDIIAMKMNVVSRGGRKKDFWNLHFLVNEFSLSEMFAFHAQRRRWEHDPDLLLQQFLDFDLADTFPNPVCLLGKNWDDIKLDLIEAVDEYNKM